MTKTENYATDDDIEMTHKHMQRCAIPFANREIKKKKKNLEDINTHLSERLKKQQWQYQAGENSE